jgi:transposase InsO family protein
VSKPEVLIQAVVVEGLSYGQTAARYGVSKTLVHRLHHRWLAEGDAAFLPRSSRPVSSPNQTPAELTARILRLREELTSAGLDAGADTIHAHLDAGRTCPSRATIWRILKRAGTITPQPQKRPRSSFIRFTAERPNQTWQSDFTHWVLTTGHDTEIIGWLDDHSRYMLHLTAHRRVSGKTVTDTFTATAAEHGFPASTLTDNGNVYTTKYAGGAGGRGTKNAFETLLALEGILQKNGRPYRPTTQGKIERFWQTLKKYLKAHPTSRIAELQGVLDEFRTYYNEKRPHRALNRRTPASAYGLIPKAEPTTPDDPNIWRVRYDTIDTSGKVSLRYGNKMMHLGIGRAHARTEIIILIHNLHATIITLDGTVLGDYKINPNQAYQPKTKTVEPQKPGVQPFTTS